MRIAGFLPFLFKKKHIYVIYITYGADHNANLLCQ